MLALVFVKKHKAARVADQTLNPTLRVHHIIQDGKGQGQLYIYSW